MLLCDMCYVCVLCMCGCGCVRVCVVCVCVCVWLCVRALFSRSAFPLLFYGLFLSFSLSLPLSLFLSLSLASSLSLLHGGIRIMHFCFVSFCLEYSLFSLSPSLLFSIFLCFCVCVCVCV